MTQAKRDTIEPSLKYLQTVTQQDMKAVNDTIIRVVEQQHVPLITNITHHIIKSGGKRLRPILTTACARLLSYETGTRHIQLAAAVELIHTATLLHDDVVDESTMRRGMETANEVWSNQASVLVGDYLLSRAFQLMVADGSMETLQILSDASATISQGEVLQLMAAGDLNTSKETYLDIIHAKTATLFSAACEVAPVIAGKESLRGAFKRFGKYLGIAFQLVDDVLDYSASQATLGKTIGDDLREGKITLPVIETYKSCNASERKFWDRVIADGMYQEGDIEIAMSHMKQYGALEIAISLAYDYADKAHAQLDTINGDSEVTQALHSCVAFCVSRVS